jgi:hypothetical protein
MAVPRKTAENRRDQPFSGGGEPFLQQGKKILKGRDGKGLQPII